MSFWHCEACDTHFSDKYGACPECGVAQELHFKNESFKSSAKPRPQRATSALMPIARRERSTFTGGATETLLSPFPPKQKGGRFKPALLNTIERSGNSITFRRSIESYWPLLLLGFGASVGLIVFSLATYGHEIPTTYRNIDLWYGNSKLGAILALLGLGLAIAFGWQLGRLLASTHLIINSRSGIITIRRRILFSISTQQLRTKDATGITIERWITRTVNTDTHAADVHVMGHVYLRFYQGLFLGLGVGDHHKARDITRELSSLLELPVTTVKLSMETSYTSSGGSGGESGG